MRILFSTTAGAGHFGPLVPFARAAKRAGHDVLVAAPESFQATVEGAGFAFAAFASRADADAGAMFARMGPASFDEANLIMIRDGFATLYPRAALPALLRLVDDWRPDVIVRETAEMASLAAAIGRGIPRAHVATGLLGVMDMISDEALGPLAGVAAEHGLKIPSNPSPFVDEPTLTLTPASLDDRGRGPTHRYHEPLEASEPDPSLVGDDPLVYLTFGTEAAGMGLYPDIYRAAIGALAGGGWRVLATVGRSADPAALGPLPPGVRVEQWMPQDAILPHAAAVVFHGGYGSMLGALRAGVPLVTMPLFSIDQRENGERIAERGVGLSIGGPEALGELASAVSTVLADPRFRSAAEAQAAEIRALPSVEESVTVLTALAG
jgi:UDP:flavonoid glycosyltransferase YjiC (YdhE family)